jgi:type IV pilus assembly protein PilY1
MGKYGATTYAGDATTVTTAITPPALALNNTKCTYNATNGGGPKTLTAAQCRDMLLDYTFGVQSFSGGPADFPFVTRYGNAFGDVFHATPTVVGPPGSLLRDDSYIGFAATSGANAYGSRKTVVYAATNDGLLHAFWADETKLENNELWALMPPAVMPNLLSSYPSSHQFLLDGSPVVKDVVWDRPVANQGLAQNWHTMLVAGFGPTQRGYYAVDVTNPDTTGMPSGAVPGDPPPKGPVFMWQLANMPGTNAPLFGAQSGTPAITTVFMDPGDGKGQREIGVKTRGRRAPQAADRLARACPRRRSRTRPPADLSCTKHVPTFAAGERIRSPRTRSSDARSRWSASTRARLSACSCDSPMFRQGTRSGWHRRRASSTRRSTRR